MSKTSKIFNAITLYILAIFSIAIIGTYLSDYLVSINWFGDYVSDTRSGWDGSYERWGARHYWYNWGMFLLFVLSIVRAIVGVDEILKEKED